MQLAPGTPQQSASRQVLIGQLLCGIRVSGQSTGKAGTTVVATWPGGTTPGLSSALAGIPVPGVVATGLPEIVALAEIVALGGITTLGGMTTLGGTSGQHT